MANSFPKFLRLTALMLLARPALPGTAPSVVVVANVSVTGSAISQDELQEVFLGTRHSLANGSRVIPVLLKSGSAHELFLKSYLGKSIEGFRTWWLRYVFTGQGLLPKTFASEAELIDYVARTKGAVGYVTPASVRGNVKCLAVSSESSSTGGQP